MSYTAEIDIARQYGETIARIRTYRGKRWVCLYCNAMPSRKKRKIRHTALCSLPKEITNA
jgi:Holliday junction resolvase-like predicted endonuclease